MTKRSLPSSAPNPAKPPAKPGGGWRIPEPGDVLSYSYLWHREALKGQEEGLKDRPVVVVLAASQTSRGVVLHVAPVTHSAPERTADAVEMPANVKRDLRLDRDKSWVVVTELNRFQWPGPDVRVLGDGTPFYGAIPDWLFVRVREAVGVVAGGGRTRVTKRSE